MAGTLTDIQANIVNKDKAQVEALLGAPVKKSYWKNAEPPQGATPQEIADFKANQMDEIWIYTNGRVHFTAAGKATSVDDNVLKDLPPDRDPPLVA
jgi:hypothetical protein